MPESTVQVSIAPSVASLNEAITLAAAGGEMTSAEGFNYKLAVKTPFAF
jgi:hypothetical protein